jgi:hypothetical protein
MNVTLVNGSTDLTEADLAITVKAVQYFADLVTEAWSKEAILVSSNTTAVPKTWNIYITDDKAQTGAYGYHVVENKLPAAYVSPRMCALGINYPTHLWGTVVKYPARTMTFKGLTILGKVIRLPRTVTTHAARPSIYRAGMFSVICHELAEMIADPLIDNWATIPVLLTFPLGGTVLVEVGDHTPDHFSAVVGTQEIVFPDFTLPAFYTEYAPAPYSCVNKSITAPFQFVKGAYAFLKDSRGARMMNFARAGDDRK